MVGHLRDNASDPSNASILRGGSAAPEGPDGSECGRAPLLVLALMFMVASGAYVLRWPSTPEPGKITGDHASGRESVSAETVPLLEPDIVTVIPGVHLLGRTYPNAAYVVETTEGLILVDTCKETDAGPILHQMRALHLDPTRIKLILITHAHADHVLGARALRALSGARIHVGSGDAEVLRRGDSREAMHSIFSMTQPLHSTEVDVEVSDGDVLTLADVRIQVIGTPGHTQGSVCYLMERDGLRILFTGDTILSLSDTHHLAGPGIYATTLSPHYRGDAARFETSLNRLMELPVPDLVLPGHPRSDPAPESPRVSAWWWKAMLQRGLERLQTVRLRLDTDGADFLDESTRLLLPGLRYWGSAAGIAAYGLQSPEGSLTLINAPAEAQLPQRLRAEAVSEGSGPQEVRAVLLTSCSPEATSGLRAVVEEFRCDVYAPDEGVSRIRGLLPPGSRVFPASTFDLEGAPGGRVAEIRGAAYPALAFLLHLGGKSLIFSGELPDPVTLEPEEDIVRWTGKPPVDAALALRSLDSLMGVAPDLWLPLRPLHRQNANLYGIDWNRTMDHTRRFLEKESR